MARPHMDETMDFLTSIVGEEVRSIDEDFGNGYVRLAVSEAQRRQAQHDIRNVESVVIELLRNARDAQARTVYVATAVRGTCRTLVVLDDGVGIEPSMWERIFEPRVTSKLESLQVDEWGVHGRGMALYSVRANALSAQVAKSIREQGSSINVEIDTSYLEERADQSTWPTLICGDDNEKVRGPHNIIRTIVEFVLEHPDVDVFYGSIPAIAATIHHSDEHEWIGSALSRADEAIELQEVAKDVGLVISERTAYRIISKQIAPVQSINIQLHDTYEERQDVVGITEADLDRDARGLKMSPDDLDAFRLDLEKAFDKLGEKYYLDLVDRVEVRQSGETIRARFNFDKQ